MDEAKGRLHVRSTQAANIVDNRAIFHCFLDFANLKLVSPVPHP